MDLSKEAIMLIKINVLLTQVDRATELQLSHLVSNKLESVIGFSSLFSPSPTNTRDGECERSLELQSWSPLQKHEVLSPTSRTSFPAGDGPTDSEAGEGSGAQVL